MGDGGQDLMAFLGVRADRRLLHEDADALPDGERHRAVAVASRRRDALVAVGSLLTGTTLVVGALTALYGGARLSFGARGAVDVVLLIVGLLLAGTHWGWVHLAEYAGVSLDDRRRRDADTRTEDWLAAVEPYPRLSVRTAVLDDASIRVERVRHRPVLTGRGTFTFAAQPDGGTVYPPETSAAVIAEGVETMRREARLQTDRVRGGWEAASTAYAAAVLDASGDEEHLAAQRAAATALSEHLNASLLEPPLVE